MCGGGGSAVLLVERERYPLRIDRTKELGFGAWFGFLKGEVWRLSALGTCEQRGVQHADL